MRRVLLIRHGQSEWQTGESVDLDSPLTALGHDQARVVARHLAATPALGIRQAWFVTSGMQRAVATARMIAALAAPDAVVHVDAELAEAPFHVAGEDGSRAGSIATERYRIFYARSVACWAGLVDRVLAQREPATNVIVSHNGFIKCVLRSVTGRSEIAPKVANGSITEILVEESGTTIQAVGDIRHLPGTMVTL